MNNRLVKLSLMILLSSLLIVFVFLLLKENSSKNNIHVNKGSGEEKEESVDGVDAWKTYVNKEYGFSLKYPNLLLITEQESVGDYLFFVSFDSTKYTQRDGIRVGVSKSSQEKVIENIQESFDEDYKVIVDRTYEVNGNNFKEKQYEDVMTKQKKAFAFLADSGLVFSISTSPDQLKEVVDSFEIIKDLGINCGDKNSCPSGFFCDGGVCIKTNGSATLP
jgi:hypothetical protein